MSHDNSLYRIEVKAVKKPCVCQPSHDSVRFRPYDSTDDRIPVEGQMHDGWSVREEFLAISDVDGLLCFLKKFGYFREKQPRGKLALEAIRRWQAASRWMLTHPASDWGWFTAHSRKDFSSLAEYYGPLLKFGKDIYADVASNRSFPLQFAWEIRKAKRHPHACIFANDVLTAILATIYLDASTEREFGICARPDCARPYPITSKHERSYCSQACAHLEAMRRMRAAPKKRKRPSRKVEARVTKDDAMPTRQSCDATSAV